MEQIATATVEDVSELADLLTMLFTQEADFQPDREKQIRGLQRIIEDPQRGLIFAARLDGKIIGMVNLLFTISTAEGEPVCWLEDMVVQPDHRGTGLGGRLLEHVIQYAKKNGFARITLLTDQTNRNAIRFYQRHEFRLSEMIPLRLYLSSSIH